MKSKLYFLSFILLLFTISSCKKWMPENRIVGTWRLVDTEKRRLFDRDDVNTGYENGLFTFYDNGTSMYKEGSLQLDGNWEMRKSRRYNNADGDVEERTIFIIRLHNFSANIILDWYFDW